MQTGADASLAIDAQTEGLVCASSIMTADISKKMFLVGGSFMRKYYTIFDRGNDRIGLAEAVTGEKLALLEKEEKIKLSQAGK